MVETEGMSNDSKRWWRGIIFFATIFMIAIYGLHVVMNWDFRHPDSDILATVLFFWTSVVYTMVFSAAAGSDNLFRNILRIALILFSILIEVLWSIYIHFEKSEVIGVFGTISLALIVVGDFLASEKEPPRFTHPNPTKAHKPHNQRVSKIERAVSLCLIARALVSKR